MSLRTISRGIIAGVIVVFVAIAALAATTARGVPRAEGRPAYQDYGALLRGRPAPTFSLLDQNGRRITLASLHGHAVMLTFFYTHCPDTCPLTAQKIRTAIRRFGREASRVSVVIVTTDPLHDDRVDATAFLRRNGLSNWHFLLGSYRRLVPLWKRYAIYVPSRSGRLKEGPAHSAVMYLIDTSGHEQALLDDGVVAAASLVQDLHILLNDHQWWTKRPVAPIVGAVPPAFSLTGMNGGSIRLTHFRGTPLLINFWATWCIPCRTEMPLLARTYRKDRGRLNIVGIDEQEPAAVVRAFVRQFHATYPIALDTLGTAMYAYQIIGTPTSFFVNKQGVITHVKVGEIDAAEMATQVRSLLTTGGMR
ncbi:MAG TPA: redoxin domain-containing protein [Chloroflexota bacterium]|nr:redoxin domain-containing protein [Chloroflexota bacterium]